MCEKTGTKLRSVDSWSQSGHRDVKCCMGHVVNNIVMTVCGVKGDPDASQ